MSTPLPQRVPGEQARRRILESAERLLAQRRFRDLTVDAVMADAGLARTVFYRHFTDLPRLVLGLFDDLLDAVLDEADAAEVPTDPSVLRRMLARTVDFFAQHGPLISAFEEAARQDDEIEAAHRAFLERSITETARLLERGVATGHLRPLPIHEVARALNLLNAAYLVDVFGRGSTGDRDTALETLWTVWSRTVIGTSSSGRAGSVPPR
jgi:AcrR family transcriptional regulator